MGYTGGATKMLQLKWKNSSSRSGSTSSHWSVSFCWIKIILTSIYPEKANDAFRKPALSPDVYKLKKCLLQSNIPLLSCFYQQWALSSSTSHIVGRTSLPNIEWSLLNCICTCSSCPFPIITKQKHNFIMLELHFIV